MKTLELICARQSERGITTAELSRRTGIEYEQLRTALQGTRSIKSDEFVTLCMELNLGIKDFKK